MNTKQGFEKILREKEEHYKLREKLVLRQAKEDWIEDLLKKMPKEKRLDVGNFGVDSITLEKDKKPEIWTQEKRIGYNQALSEIKLLLTKEYEYQTEIKNTIQI
jgi:hypothetical protein